MSDLHCPAIVLLIAQESLASAEASSALYGRHIARVFATPALALDADGAALLARLGAELACPLDALAAAVTDATSLRDALDRLADVSRGETLAVVVPADWIRHLVGAARSSNEPIALAIDADGWVLLRDSSRSSSL